ncbi:hypothetical protein DN402_06755 [Streptomyces sp. SW4]|nr:hypothetical protein DN402_06755 [Streptomyces sp. SW4]
MHTEEGRRTTADPARRPRSVTVAVVLIVLGAPTAATTAAGPGQAGQLMVLLVVACLWCAVRAGRGRRTARTAVVCLLAAVFVLAAAFAFDDPLYGGATLLLALALAGPGAALLYRPAARAYVRARSEGRRREPHARRAAVRAGRAAGADPVAVAVGNASLLGVGYLLLGRRGAFWGPRW